MIGFIVNSLPRKILLTLVLLGITLAILTLFSLRSGIVPAFETLEAKESLTTLTRLEQAIESQFQMLDLFNAEYSSWDVVYDAVQQPGTFDKFAREQVFSPRFWAEVDISMMLFFDREGQKIWGSIIDPLDRVSLLPFEENMGSLIDGGLDPTRHNSAGHLHGFFGTPHGIMLVSTRPILKNDDSGPEMGTLAVGRFVTRELIENLGRSASVEVKFIPVTKPDLPQDAQEAISILSNSPTSSLTVRSADTIYSRKLISDIGGHPLALVEVRKERFIGKIGAQSIKMTMAVMSLVIAFIILTAWQFLGKLIVKPTVSLIDQITKIRRTGDLSILPSTDQKGEIGILADEFGGLLSELDGAYRALKTARDEALRMASAKSKFLATMSHEIRTPMNGVLGMAEILQGTNLDPKQQTMVRKIQDSGNHLLAIINDILDFSKIESQNLKLVNEDFNLRDLLEEVVDILSVQASMKNLELTKRFNASVDQRFVSDPNRINQIIVNLVGNAIKFTDQGRVLVKAAIREQDAGPAVLRVEISDTGIGISKKQQSDIFKEFSQADDSLARQYQGTGLGLAICKALLHMMDGKIELESELGKGSCFWFELPLPASHGYSPPQEPLRTPQDLNALVVGGETPDFADLDRMLVGFGVTPSRADDLSDIPTILKNAQLEGSPYDLALLDWDMPGINGLQIARMIRADEQLSHLPIVLLGSPRAGDERLVSSDVYIDRYLAKPVSRSSLYACLFDLSRKIRKRTKPSETKPTGTESKKIRADVLLVEDNPVNQQVGKTMLDQNGCSVMIAENGAAALDILEDRQFDLILMDCQMPEMDGFEATAMIRSREAATGVHVPIIAVTADVVEGVREKCINAGMDGYLTKPFSALQLRQELLNWLPNATTGEETRENSKSPD